MSDATPNKTSDASDSVVPGRVGVPVTDRVRLNLKLSRATHGRIRVWCAQRGVSMQSAVEKMLDTAFEKAGL